MTTSTTLFARELPTDNLANLLYTYIRICGFVFLDVIDIPLLSTRCNFILIVSFNPSKCVEDRVAAVVDVRKFEKPLPGWAETSQLQLAPTY